MAPPRPVSFRVDEELMAWVRETADKRGLTLSAVVESALVTQRRLHEEGPDDLIVWVEHPSQKGGRGTPRRQPPPKPAKPTWA